MANGYGDLGLHAHKHVGWGLRPDQPYLAMEQSMQECHVVAMGLKLQPVEVDPYWVNLIL